MGSWSRSRVGGAVVALLTLIVLGWAATYEFPADAGAPSTLADWDGPQPPRQKPVALWIGDSFTAGTGADSAEQAESCLASQFVGWTCLLDAQGGTGFIADGTVNSPNFEPLAGRFPDSWRVEPDVVIIDAGRNDVQFPRRQLREAVSSYLERVRERWPDTELVLIAPYQLLGTQPPGGEWFVGFLQRQAAVHDATFIDPIAAGWIPAKPIHVSPDGVHPSAAGHRYLARNLAREFRAADLV